MSVTFELVVVIVDPLRLSAVPVMEIAPEVVSAPLKVVVPVPATCVMLVPLMATAVQFVQLLTVRAPKLVAAPDIVMLPVPAVRPREKVPSRVDEKVMLPAPAPLLRATLPVRVTALKKEIAVFVVVISPAVETAPAPFWVKAPVLTMSPAAAIVNVPELVNVVVPAQLMLLFRFCVVPVMAILPVVVKMPLKVVVPVPALCVMELAVIAMAVQSAALFTKRAAIAVVPPTAPVIVILPVPAVRVTASVFAVVPFKVLANAMLPAPAPLLKVADPPIMTAPLNEMLLFAVVTLAPDATVRLPELPKVTVPPAPVVVAVLFNAMVTVVIEMAPEVLKAPPNVVVPVPATCVMLAAVMPLEVQLPALLTVSAERGVPPTTPVIVMVPAPAVRAKLLVPPIVDPKEIPALLVFIATLPVSVTAVPKVMVSLDVVMSPAVLTAPAPFCKKAPSQLMSPAAAIVKSPPFVKVTAPLRLVLMA